MPWADFEYWRHRSMLTDEQAYTLLARAGAPRELTDKIAVGSLHPIEARLLLDKMDLAQRNVPYLINGPVSLCYSVGDPASSTGETSRRMESFPTVADALERSRQLRLGGCFVHPKIMHEGDVVWSENDILDWIAFRQSQLQLAAIAA
jgi:hypothetical protein